MRFSKAGCCKHVEDLGDGTEKFTKAEAEKLAKVQSKTVKDAVVKKEASYEDPLSTEADLERELSLNEKARKLYPERGCDPYKPCWFNVLWKGEGREGLDKIKCETKVWEVIQHSYLVRLLLDALKSSGCEIDLCRHISCEVCDISVTGGFDPTLNHVVICENTARYKGIIQGALTHELIHMFDNCRHKLNFKTLQHLACTEIRAANVAHCSYLSGLTDGSLSFGNVKEQHQTTYVLELYVQSWWFGIFQKKKLTMSLIQCLKSATMIWTVVFAVIPIICRTRNGIGTAWATILQTNPGYSKA